MIRVGRLILISTLVAFFIRTDCVSLESRNTPQARRAKAHAQVTSEARSDSPASIFGAVESGIRTGDIAAFDRLFANQIYLNLRGMESGYYSASQASYILRNHFSFWKAVSFRFSTMSDTEPNPFATGSGRFANRSTVERFQLYVALSQVDGRWKITQFNVY